MIATEEGGWVIRPWVVGKLVVGGHSGEDIMRRQINLFNGTFTSREDVQICLVK